MTLVFLAAKSGWTAALSFSRRTPLFVLCPKSSFRNPVRLRSSVGDDESISSLARILFLGTPDVAAASLRRLHDAGPSCPIPYEIVGAVTQPPRPAGRKRKLTPSPVHVAADALGIPVLFPEKASDPAFLDALESTQGDDGDSAALGPIDLAVTAAYGNYLPRRFLALPRRGTLNVHPSLLPRWRGASPVQRSLEAGDATLGTTVLFTVQKMDAGPLVSQVEIPATGDEMAGETLESLFMEGTEALLRSIPEVLTGKITMETAKVQEEEGITHAAMIGKEEGILRPNVHSAEVAHNKVRAFDMWPGCTLLLNVGESKDEVKVKVGRTRIVPVDDELLDMIDLSDNSIVLPKKKGRGLMLQCGDGSVLELLEIQPPTKKMMDAKSFINGLKGAALKWVELEE
eukprot:CAMPEP_0113311588 /NCGR_PEP_ID=MMETSP0010_2-20120614/8763_1 /TAXON_ID=216773 ORGANISM="Corethron hystrix, Strain 308" /NCGR_SAMPLE_ID=MMETSP0010_2 /ASSEMBLY_ACC=CAM_ASM_000155 /LENGTH=400 /DNA_ID=CAMNT_0000167253 /DNA_START=165 /DNA_END=1367 /DNA_ORIENTATION=+ /assembly_acc=CAM_ASM_000155